MLASLPESPGVRMRRSACLVAATAAGTLIASIPLASPNAVAATASAKTPLAAQASQPSGIAAKGAYLYDATKGKKLWGVATTTKRPIGSITKVMTALVVIRSGGLDRKVTVKKSYVDHVKNNDATTAGLKV